MSPKVSIITSTFNEAGNPFFFASLERNKQLNPDQVEIVFIDGGSQDGTLETLEQATGKVHSLPHSNRAQRYNHGAKVAKAPLLLLHHPRSVVSQDGIELLFEEKLIQHWGGFTHMFHKASWALEFTSWYSNRIRASIKGIFYLDHCIFVPKNLYMRIGMMPEIDLFEDTALSVNLKKHSRPKLLRETSLTSAIRFKENGFIKQSILNQLLKLSYYIRRNPKKMAGYYEKGLGLNEPSQ